tara:strand:+ start:106 stop:300 length:195 start_codon:yes stop_codon:yes gene_type:complete
MNSDDKILQYNSLRERYQKKLEQIQKLIENNSNKDLQNLESIYSYRVSAIDRCIEYVKKEVESQ